MEPVNLGRFDKSFVVRMIRDFFLSLLLLMFLGIGFAFVMTLYEFDRGGKQMVMFGLGSFEVGITLRGRQTLGLGPAEIGLIFTVCGLVMVGVQAMIFSPLITRFGAGRVLAPAFLVMAVGLWVLPYGTDLTVIGVLVGWTAAGAGVLIPALAYLVSLSAEAFQGKALGRQTAAASLGQALGSVAAGALFGIMAQAPFWLPMALLSMGAGISLTTAHVAPKSVQEQWR